MKRLIVTADDLGLHRGMTDGAIRAHEDGVVTAVSVSACGRELSHAIDAVRHFSGLDVGIHFTLVEERPVLAAREVPSLVARDGRFVPSYRELVGRWATGRLDPDEVGAELHAQARVLADAGLKLTHANGHQHLHLLPGVVSRVIEVCRARDIRYVRAARDEGIGAHFDARTLSVRALNLLGRLARSSILGAGLVCNDRTIGIAAAGHVTAERLRELLPRVRGVTELVMHPGTGSADIARDYAWGYEWDAETAALRDPSLRTLIAEHAIELVGPSSVA
jgi:chitin disaccharide deacetylase